MTVRVHTSALGSLIVGLVCLLAGCGLDNRSAAEKNALNGNRAQKSAAIFTEIVHPILSTNCGACHGSSQAPTFALPSAPSALSIIESNGLISMLDAGSSRLVIRGGSAHGGCTKCGSGVSGQLKDAIAEWNTRMLQIPEETVVPPSPTEGRTAVGPVNVNIPVGSTTPIQVSFSLEPLGIAGGSIGVRITRSGANYILDRIKVVAAGSPIAIADVLPVIDGELQVASAGWRSIDTVVGTQRSVTVTTDILQPASTSITTLALSIVKISAATARTCKTPTLFAPVQTIITNRCAGCHRTGGPGEAFWTNGANNCETFLERSVPGAVSKSAPVGMPGFQLFGHPVVPGLTQVEVAAIANWYALGNP